MEMTIHQISCPERHRCDPLIHLGTCNLCVNCCTQENTFDGAKLEFVRIIGM
jgi:hypothetical protein